MTSNPNPLSASCIDSIRKSRRKREEQEKEQLRLEREEQLRLDEEREEQLILEREEQEREKQLTERNYRKSRRKRLEREEQEKEQLKLEREKQPKEIRKSRRKRLEREEQEKEQLTLEREEQLRLEEQPNSRQKRGGHETKKKTIIAQPEVNKNICPPMICRSKRARNFIMCDQCQQWYHMMCVNIKPQTVANIDRYICKLCL